MVWEICWVARAASSLDAAISCAAAADSDAAWATARMNARNLLNVAVSTPISSWPGTSNCFARSPRPSDTASICSPIVASGLAIARLIALPTNIAATTTPNMPKTSPASARR